MGDALMGSNGFLASSSGFRFCVQLAVDHGFAVGRSHFFDAFANDRPDEERNLFQGLFGIKTPFHAGLCGVVH